MLMLKKKKEGSKLYETQILKFVIRLKSFKKNMPKSWLAQKGSPLCIQNNSRTSILQGLLYFMLDLCGQETTETKQRMCLSKKYLQIFSPSLDCNSNIRMINNLCLFLPSNIYSQVKKWNFKKKKITYIFCRLSLTFFYLCVSFIHSINRLVMG